MLRPSHQRGYALVFVMILGVVLASLSGILLYATSRDNIEARHQLGNARAVYAAEGAVAVGIERVRLALETNPQPPLGPLEAPAPALAGVEFPTFRIRYYDPVTNTTSTTPPASPLFAAIKNGPNAGLFASQTPIQVLATAEIGNALATVADAIRIDLIPIFQFAIFMDGDFELQNPAPIAVEGRVHTNGNFYVTGANGNNILFTSPITIAKSLHNSAAVDPASGIGDTQVSMPTGSGQEFLRNTPALPEADPADQAAYLSSTFGTQVLDSSLGQEPLNVPINIAGRTACTTTCVAANEQCVKQRPTDANGFCMPRIVSRPSLCGDLSSTAGRAEFAQSLAIEVIKRPEALYANALGALYDDGVAASNLLTSDFGPEPADVDGAGGVDRVTDQAMTARAQPRNVPLMNIAEADDDPGARKERMYWKAHIRIIDGVWYRASSNTPVFDPETWDFGVANYAPNAMPANVELGHLFARVLRYSWFWDPREGREYAAGDLYQRGLQIRATDFDVAAFRELLANSTAVTLLFGGAVPDSGIIVYVSETHDSSYEDANTVAPRAANVRNYLNFHILDNHLGPAVVVPVGAPTKGGGGNQIVATGRGWFASNIWGRNAPVGHRSLTIPQSDANPNGLAALGTLAETIEYQGAYRAPRIRNASVAQWSATDANGCIEPSLLSASVLPSTATGIVAPPCIQTGATPLGAENAVRIVRAQSIPDQGLTIATDNRAYIHGDVNVISAGGTGALARRFDSTTIATNQRIAGKISIVADSVTLLSSRFSDRVMQRGSPGDQARISPLPRFTSTAFNTDGTALALPLTVPWSAEAVQEDGPGGAPNLCGVAKNISNAGGTGGGLALELPAGWPGGVSRNLRRAVATRFNASLLMGDVPACLGAGNGVGNANGGVNNFPRFIENWQDIDNVIFGSMVSLFRSERGNARFLTSGMTNAYAAAGFTASNWTAQRKADPYESSMHCVYTPPIRNWAFDPGLTNPSNLPPGTPRVFANDRIRWVRR